MKDKHVCTVYLAVISLTAFLAPGAEGQQSATAPKPAETGAPAAPGTGTGANSQTTASSQKVVLKVGTTQVTESEIDSLVSKLGPRARTIVAKEGRRPVGDEYVKMLLLSKQAIDEHLDSSPAVRSQLELQRAQTLAEAQYQKMASQVQVSQEEVSQYFSAHRPEFESVQVRQFVIRKRPQGSKDPKQGLPVGEAKTTAESVRKALLAGKKVEDVALDFATPNNAVMLIDQKTRTLRRAEMAPALASATFAVEGGGVSELVDTPQAFMVVKVLGHLRPELKDVSAEIETKLRQQRLDADIDELKKKAGVWMDQEYFTAKPAPASAQTAKP